MFLVVTGGWRSLLRLSCSVNCPVIRCTAVIFIKIEATTICGDKVQTGLGTWDTELLFIWRNGPRIQKIFCILLRYASFVSRVASRSQSSVGLQRKERLQEVDTLDIRAVNGSSRNFSLFAHAKFPISRLMFKLLFSIVS